MAGPDAAGGEPGAGPDASEPDPRYRQCCVLRAAGRGRSRAAARQRRAAVGVPGGRRAGDGNDFGPARATAGPSGIAGGRLGVHGGSGCRRAACRQRGQSRPGKRRIRGQYRT
ncbi:hypothetical protein G6F65_020109 [Rhizopus arrhizus]|nr:hypothetical protein G6F65_020109 [Rhizopus arrhizus]KAG1374184.1 hypothetical protein G6F59_018431 [Rhizopus arrhizus]